MKLVFGKVAIAAAAMLAGASPAMAQRDTGQYGRPEQTPENMARFALFRSSFCALKNASATANKVLNTGIASAEEAKLVKSLRTVARQCYEPQWPAFPSTAVRNTLAEINYRNDFRIAPAATAAGTKPPESFRVAAAGATGTPEQESAWYLGALANCVAFVDPPLAHDFVVGPAGVPEEEKRFDKLKPALAQCGPAGGVPGMKAQVMRGYLADALLEQGRARTKAK